MFEAFCYENILMIGSFYIEISTSPSWICFVFLPADAKKIGLVQAKLGDTANFTWSYKQVIEQYGKISKIKLGPYQNGKFTGILGAIIDSKAVLNPNLPAEFKGRVDFINNDLTKSATFLYKDIKTGDDNRIFGIDVSANKGNSPILSELQIVGESYLLLFKLKFT